MNTLRESANFVCICLIACSILGVIAPLNRMRKIVNLLLGVFIITSLLIPALSFADMLSTDFTLDEQAVDTNHDSQYQYEQMVLEQTADNLVSCANNLLLQEDIVAENIEIFIKKTDNNSIYISGVNIYISKEYEHRAQDIRKIIGTNMSKEPVIIVSEE